MVYFNYKMQLCSLSKATKYWQITIYQITGQQIQKINTFDKLTNEFKHNVLNTENYV